MMLEHVLVLSAFYFLFGIYGLITSRNMVRALMCLELLVNSVNRDFVTFYDMFEDCPDSFSIFLIAIAAAEAAIGLVIVSSIYRDRKSLVLTNPIC